jgi:hypothetical protein
MTHLRVAQFTGRQVHPGNKIDHWREPGKKTDFGRKTMVGADNKRHGTAKVQKYRKALSHLILCPYLSVLLSVCVVVWLFCLGIQDHGHTHQFACRNNCQM